MKGRPNIEPGTAGRAPRALVAAGVLLLLSSVACGHMPTADCSSPGQPSGLAQLSILQPAEPGQLYLFNGIIYWDFEDGGLIATELSDRRALEIFEHLKFDAFCYRVTPSCGERLDALRLVGKRKVMAARMRALVRFAGWDERRAPLTVNQCRSGDVVIESILAFHPLRYTAAGSWRS